MENYKYCPYCKNELIEKPECYQCPNCKTTLFKHPALAAGVFIVNKRKVLLGRRAVEPKKGFYDIVGGFVQYKEIPQHAAIREVKEETGIECKLDHLIGIYSDEYLYQKKLIPTMVVVYISFYSNGEFAAKDDVEELRWYPIDKPPQNLAFPFLKQSLNDLKKWLHNNEQPD